MFDKADSVSARARVMYKQYPDVLAKQMPTNEKGDYVFMTRPSTEAKTVPEKKKTKHTPN